jgi:hypothetical protein
MIIIPAGAIIVRAVTTPIIDHVLPATIFTPAIVTISSPIPPSSSVAATSVGGCPSWGDGRPSGVAVTSFPLGGGGAGGGIHERGAAATTTDDCVTVTTAAMLALTITPPPQARSSSSSSWVLIINDNSSGLMVGSHTLLPLMIELTASIVSNIRGRGHASGGPQRTHHFLAHSLPSPTVAMGRAAWRSIGGRPTAFANTTLAAAAPPRPGHQASLLSPSSRPQHGRVT